MPPSTGEFYEIATAGRSSLGCLIFIKKKYETLAASILARTANSLN